MTASFVRCRICSTENRVYGPASESRCNTCASWLYDDDVLPVSQNLFETTTYQRTGRLRELLEGYVDDFERYDREIHPPLAEDVLALWSTYCEGAESTGTKPALFEFAAWLLGARGTAWAANESGFQRDVEPAEVIW